MIFKKKPEPEAIDPIETGEENPFIDAANELAEMEENGELPEGFELSEAVKDYAFAALLSEFEPKAAVRIYVAEKRAEEAENNLIIANHLKRYLESQGATVVLGRTEEDRGKVDDNTRAKIFRNAGCTYVIRLKCNYINAKTSACYVKVTKKNKAFGQRMINAYVAATGMQKQNGKKDGVQVEDDTVAEKCGCPCVAFLMGNWDNETDYANLHDEVFMDKITEGIFNGLMAEISDEPGSTEADAPLEAPTITTQPTDVTVVEGGNLNLSVVATGSDLKYQWELKAPMGAWTKLTSTSARTANLSIPNVQTRHTGYTYRCTVSNKAGKVTSNVVTLTVNPASTSQP